MSIVSRLNFGFKKAVPIVLQTEISECGLACLAMLAGHYGHNKDLRELRAEYTISQKGADLNTIAKIADSIGFSTRSLSLELDEIRLLRIPAILHWNMDHFVVLTKVADQGIIIHDPAIGQRFVSWKEVHESFTGIAMEAWPGTKFQKISAKPKLSIMQFAGDISGFWPTLIQIFGLAVGLEILHIVIPLLSQWVVDYVFVSQEKNLLVTVIVGLCTVTLISEILSVLRSWILLYVSTTLSIQWRTNVLSTLFKLPVSYFEKRTLGDVLSRLGSVDAIQNVLTHQFVSVVLDGVMVVALLAIMLVYSPALTLVAALSVMAYLLGRILWYLPFKTASYESIVAAAKVSTNVMESIRGIKSVKLFNREQQRLSTYSTALVNATNTALKVEKLNIGYRAWSSITGLAASCLVIYVGANMVFEGLFSVGMYIAFGTYKDQFVARCSGLINAFFDVKMLDVQKDRLADIVLNPRESEGVSHITGHVVDLIPVIEFKNVVFRFSEYESNVLNGVSFVVRPGECVAITGESGCGKTTIVNLLMRALEPVSGSIAVGGVDIKNIDASELRTLFGTVLQDDNLFAGSIEENISFFEANVDFARVKECARLAAVDADIEKMPMGYKSLVGDMGSALSGGQKQRILLARAIYKKPKILILDEASSHLDIEGENKINAGIRALNLTTITVAHRPQTISSADRILVVADGRITDGGLSVDV